MSKEIKKDQKLQFQPTSALTFARRYQQAMLEKC